MLSVMAVLSGAEDFEEIAWFGQQKLTFLRQFLSLSNGIPSHDTIRRVWMHIDPKQFNQQFMTWVADSLGHPPTTISIDGKSLGGSARKQHPALHLVSAVASEMGLSLGQVQTDAKSNEITAIPELLNLLALKGCIVTLDAMGCQISLAQQILDQQAEYVLALKANQLTLLEDISRPLDRLPKQAAAQRWEKQHGQPVHYQVWTLTDLRWIDEAGQWPGLRSAIRVQTSTYQGEHVTHHNRYYISSIADLSAPRAAELVRGHWSIENQLHWQLDVTFREDAARLSHPGAAQNMALLRKIALNLITRDPTPVSKKKKLKRMAWDEAYLMSLLSLAIQNS